MVPETEGQLRPVPLGILLKGTSDLNFSKTPQTQQVQV